MKSHVKIVFTNFFKNIIFHDNVVNMQLVSPTFGSYCDWIMANKFILLYFIEYFLSAAMKFQVHCFGKHKDFAFPLFGIDIAIGGLLNLKLKDGCRPVLMNTWMILCNDSFMKLSFQTLEFHYTNLRLRQLLHVDSKCMLILILFEIWPQWPISCLRESLMTIYRYSTAFFTGRKQRY